MLARAGVYAIENNDVALASIFETIHAEFSAGKALRELALETLLIEMTIILVRTANVETESAIMAGRGNRHFRRFVELVERHHKSKWSVARYAGALGITAPHLNTICKQHDSRSAKQVIHERVLLAARRGLAYTDVSVAGIAQNLGFVDPSYFTRFFRRFEGVTPSEFRRQTGTQPAAGL